MVWLTVASTIAGMTESCARRDVDDRWNRAAREVSLQSANAISADVSTYASWFLAIHHIVNMGR